MNQIILPGIITKNLELRTSTNNKKYTYFTLVINGYKEKINYINCVAWEKVAKNMAMYVGKDKDSQVLVNGQLITRKNNDNHNIMEIVCSNIAFIDRKKNIIDYEKPDKNKNNFTRQLLWQETKIEKNLKNKINNYETEKDLNKNIEPIC